MKKIICVLTCVLMFTLMLVGCGGGDKQAAKSADGKIRLCHNKWLIFDEKYRIIIVRNSTTEGGNWICLLSKTH